MLYIMYIFILRYAFLFWLSLAYVYYKLLYTFCMKNVNKLRLIKLQPQAYPNNSRFPVLDMGH